MPRKHYSTGVPCDHIHILKTTVMTHPKIESKATYRVRATVWLYQGPGGWHFVNLSPRQSSAIRALFGTEARPFGSIPAAVTIGKTQWKTSLFPDKKSRTYLFAIKADVRRTEHIQAGDTIVAQVKIL